MKNKNYKLTNSFVIASFALCGLVACNSSDYKDSNSSDSSAAVTTPAGASDKVADSVDKMAAASKRSVAKRKGKMTINWPANSNTDKMVKDKEGVYNWAEAAPEFPGGQNALNNYVNNNIEYPEKAIDDNTSGTVRVSFVVDEDGKVIMPHIVGNKLGNGLDEQALKAVSNMPAWKPGKVHGKNVKTRLELPIAFQVEA
ncbi:MAG TPA: energy transducer TonB [Puia sp.]|nr:energy transducer TonB [Puia sp.]